MMLDNTIKIEANSLPSLDYYEHNRNSSCGVWTAMGPKEGTSEAEWSSIRFYCKKWSCPTCGPRKVAKLRKAVVKQASEKNLQRMMTLTLDHNECEADGSIKYIKGCWGKMRTYLKRRLGKSPDFICILELQRSGHAHLHILIDRYIEQAWVSEAWSSVGGGKIVDIRFVDIQRVSRYLSKYLTKKTLLADYGKLRRYTTSREIVLFPKKPKKINSKWKILRLSIDSLYKGLAEKYALNIEYDWHDDIRSFTTNYSLLDDCPELYPFVLKPRKKKKRYIYATNND